MAEDQTQGKKFSLQSGGRLGARIGDQGSTQTQGSTQSTGASDTSGVQSSGVFLPGISGVNNKVAPTNDFISGIQSGKIQSNIQLPGITTKPENTDAVITGTTKEQQRKANIRADNNGVDKQSWNEKIENERYSSQTLPILQQGVKQTWNDIKKFSYRKGMDFVENPGKYLSQYIPGGILYKYFLNNMGSPVSQEKINDMWNNYYQYEDKINKSFDKWVENNIDQEIAQKYAEKGLFTSLKEGDWNNAKYGIKQAFSTSILPMLPGMVAGILTKNPAVLAGVGFLPSKAVEDQEAYDEALKLGASREQATSIGQTAGNINGVLEIVGEFTQLKGLLKPLKKNITKEITKKTTKQIIGRGLLDLGKGIVGEGSTEGLQELVTNALIKTVDENRDLFEGVLDSIIAGGIIGAPGSTLGAGGKIAQDVENNKKIDMKTDLEALDYVLQGEQRKAQRIEQQKEKMRQRANEKFQAQAGENAGLSDTNDYTEGRNVGGSKASSEMATEKTVNTLDEESVGSNGEANSPVTDSTFFSTDENGDYINYNGNKIYAGSKAGTKDQFTQLSDNTPYNPEYEEYFRNFQRLIQKLSDPKVSRKDTEIIGHTIKGKEVKMSKWTLRHIFETHGKFNINTLLEAINNPSGQKRETELTGKNKNKRPYMLLDIGGSNKKIIVAIKPNNGATNTDNADFYYVVSSRESNTPTTPAEDVKFQLKYEDKDYTPGVAGKNEKNISGKEGVNLRNKLNKKTVKELAEKYGIKVEVIEGMIEILENGKRKGYAYGKYIDQLLTLSEQIKESTAPHELLHAIFDMIDPETKTYLISQVMKSEGWSASKAEEWLADSFSNFFRTGKIEGAPKSTWGKIKIFFKRVRSFINGMGKWRNQLDEIFTDIIESEGIEDLQGKIDRNERINKAKERMRERFKQYQKNAEKMQKKEENTSKKSPKNWSKKDASYQIADESVYELKPLERIEQMEKLILDEYGTTDNPTRVAFIDNKGRWINGNMGGYGNYRDTDHREIAQTAFDDTDIEFNNATDGLVALQAETGLVRVNYNDGYMNIDTVYELMPSQREGLMRFADEPIKEVYVDITDPKTGRTLKSDTFMNVRDAVRWIDRNFAEEGGKYQSVEREDDKMIALHNISLEKLAKAKDLGGLVAPSIGITKSGIPFENYGEISFIANKDLVNPSKDVIVGETDLYTPRVPQPTLEWKDNVNREKQEEIAKKVGMEMGELYDYVTGYSQSHWERMYPNLAKEIAPYINKTLFKGFTEMGDRIYQPYTMKNILNDMFNKGDVGEESAMFQGNLSEAMARMSDDVKDLENVRGKIGNREGLDKEYDALSDKYTDLGWDILEGREGMAIFSENIRKSNKDIVAELADFDIEVTEKQVQELKDIVMEALKLPKSYVEAKIKRGVGFGEFSAVVVPEDKVAEVRDLIGDEIEIFGYKPGDRMNVINEVADRKDVKFQRAGDIESEAFKKRFGNSKVVDENGNPLVVYHATMKNFNIFDRSNIGEHGISFGDGFYFSNKPIKEYGKSKKTYLKMENPFVIEDVNNIESVKKYLKELGISGKDAETWYKYYGGDGKGAIGKAIRESLGDDARVSEMLKKKGYDGVIVRDTEMGINDIVKGDEYMVFEPNQIKSATDNVGTYDANNDDIRYQRVYHGSPNEFDRFDSSHMGEGEGAQAHGRGHYVAVDPETARRYAQEPFRKNEVEIKGKTMTRTEDVWDIPYALRTLYRDLYSFFSFGYYDFDTEIDNAINQIKKEYQDTVDYYKKLIEDKTIPVGVDGVDLEKLQEDRKKSLKEFEDALEFIEDLNPEDVIVRELNNRRNFYEVEIPDPVKANTPTGKNYIEEENRIGVRAFNRMLKRFEKDGREVENGYGNYTVKKGDDEITLTNPNNTWKQLIWEDITNPKLFSHILNRMGYKGIHYYGGVDGEAYVIFNDDDLEIKNHEKYQKVEYEYDENGNPKRIKFGDNSEFDPSIFGENTREEQIEEDKENEKGNPFYNAWMRYNNQNYKDDQKTFEEFMKGLSDRADKEQEIYDEKMKSLSDAQNDPKLLELQLKAIKLMEKEQNVGKKFGKNVSKEVRDRQQAEVEKERENLVKEIFDYMYPGLKFEDATYEDNQRAFEKEAEWEMLGKEDIENKLKLYKKDKNGNREAKEIKIDNPDIKLEKLLSAGKFDEIFEPTDRVIEWKTPEGQKGRIDKAKDPKKFKSVMEKINSGKTKTKVELKDVTNEVRALERYKENEKAEKERRKKEKQEEFAKKKQEEYKRMVRMKAFQRLVDMQRFEKYPFLTEEEIKNRYGFSDEEWKTITEQEEIKLPKKWGEKAISDFNKAVDDQVKALIEGLNWQNRMKQKEAEKNLGEIGEIDIDVLLGKDEEKGAREVEEFERIAEEEKKKSKKEKNKRLEQAREDVTQVEIDKERENSKSEKERVDKLIKSTKTDKTVRGSVKKFTADIITPVSTRIKEISPKIYRELMRYFQNKDILTNERLKEIDPFLKAMAKIRKENPVRFMDIWVALANRNIGYANGLLQEYGVKVPTKLLDTIFDEAEDVGLNINYLGSYYPLSVKAPKSFLEELMKINKGDIASEIEKRIQQESQKKGGPLEESEITAIINSVIAGEEKGPDVNVGNKHLKKRNTEIKRTPKMLEYCDDPISTLISYIEGMTQSIERAKFLGKSRSGNVHTLADYVYNAKNGLDPEQQDELMELLKSVFNDESPNKFVQSWRDLATLTTLGSPSSTLTQLSDLSFSVVENGWRETLKAVWDVFASRKVFDLQDMGVLNRGEEYANINSQKNLLQKAIHNVFKLTFFSNFDTFGKSTFIQSTWNKRRKRALKGENGDPQLIKDIMKITDDEYTTMKIINDLRKGVFSEDVALVMYMKLGDVQPLTKAQMPKAYLDNPNGRLFYQFKTFGIKQLDYVLEKTKENTKGWKNLSTTEKYLRVAQVANMVFVMTLLGVGADELKDITMRRKSNSMILRRLYGEDVGTEQIWEKMEDNVLKLFGLSRYTVMQMKNDPVDAITSLFTALPATNIVNYPFKDIYKAFKDDGSINWSNPSAYQLIPVVGKYRYWIYGGGQEKQQEALDKENKKKTTTSGGSSRSTRNTRSRSRNTRNSR